MEENKHEVDCKRCGKITDDWLQYLDEGLVCRPCFDELAEKLRMSKRPKIKLFDLVTLGSDQIQLFVDKINKFIGELESERISVDAQLSTTTMIMPQGPTSGGVLIAKQDGAIPLEQRMFVVIMVKVEWY